MAISGTKPWLNPYKKMSFFSSFSTSGFYSLERLFFVLEYRERHFPFPILRKKRSLEKWPFFYQNDGLTPLEKCQFFDFLNILFL